MHFKVLPALVCSVPLVSHEDHSYNIKYMGFNCSAGLFCQGWKQINFKKRLKEWKKRPSLPQSPAAEAKEEKLLKGPFFLLSPASTILSLQFIRRDVHIPITKVTHVFMASADPGTLTGLSDVHPQQTSKQRTFSNEKFQLERKPVLLDLCLHSHAAATTHSEAEAVEGLRTRRPTQRELSCHWLQCSKSVLEPLNPSNYTESVITQNFESLWEEVTQKSYKADTISTRCHEPSRRAQ